jgi:glycosyltransferase involved in cell wall biosynthesis
MPAEPLAGGPTPRTVLLVHNRYLERGGEDTAYEAEGALLERFGHRVLRYERDNREVAGIGAGRLAARTVWSTQDHRDVGRVVSGEGVDVVHFHNTLPLISPAAHYAARAAGAAVVQTLHNFRLLCAGGLFLRDGAPCEKCLGLAVPWPAVAHRCYRSSAAASGAIAGMQVAHRALRTWHRQVDAFIVLSSFARQRFLAGGIPAERLFVKTGVMEEVAAPDAAGRGSHFLYVGRLAAEKGIGVLLDAWTRLPRDCELRIIGDGPLRSAVEHAAGRDPRIQYLGPQPRDEVLRAMAQAGALVFPSLCYENYPGVLAEAQAAGLPVLASRLGSGGEIVAEAGCGILFEASDAAALADAAVRLRQDPPLRAEFGRRGRAAYETRLAPGHAYQRLVDIYDCALRHRHDGARRQAEPGNP